MHRRLTENASGLPDHVLKDYVKALTQFMERADEKRRLEQEQDEGFVLLDSLDGLPQDRAAQLLVGEIDRLAELHAAHFARLQLLVGDDEAYELLEQLQKEE